MKAGYIVWGREFIGPRVGWGKWLKIKGRNRFEHKDEAVDVADRCMAMWPNNDRYQMVVSHRKKIIYSIGRQPLEKERKWWQTPWRDPPPSSTTPSTEKT